MIPYFLTDLNKDGRLKYTDYLTNLIEKEILVSGNIINE